MFKEEIIDIILMLVSLAFIIDRLKDFFILESREGEVFYKWLTILPAATYFLTIISASTEFLMKRNGFFDFSVIVGFVLLTVGVFIRKWSTSALRECWSKHIKLFPEHRIVKGGPYKQLRHPYLLSVFFELAGFCLFLHAYYSLLLILFIQAPLLVLRAVFEERILIERFGEQYQTYRKETYCL